MEKSKKHYSFKKCWNSIKVWSKRWYSYNKQKIPMIFILIGTFLFTAFLDFEVKGSDIKLVSHIHAVRQLSNIWYNNLGGFYLFAIYLIAIIQLFNALSFAKKRSPIGLILITFLTFVQTALVGTYSALFFIDQAKRSDYTIDSVANFSITIFISGAILFIIGTIFAWRYVNWNYVKEVD